MAFEIPLNLILCVALIIASSHDRVGDSQHGSLRAGAWFRIIGLLSASVFLAFNDLQKVSVLLFVLLPGSQPRAE
jgi:hypothetical protein